ncbi:putative mitochondrial chaperone bcs1 [Cyphellophora attinorum]|uniref:Putative mitochondrial chaperone bcs1 n=1 Tax=Cyphellophora attinorum TaxID=1664694 RepID=A0A0N1HCX2_9EURO|nr:putative mitochondrial chaperone bcs1 [Phialophora attinorum]KPI41904.1 putative mitochondrial chaperone bcs1 [Phialophora attinorum]
MSPPAPAAEGANAGSIAALFPVNIETSVTPVLIRLCRKYPKTTRLLGVLLAAMLPFKLIKGKLLSMLEYLLPFVSTTYQIQEKDPMAALLRPWLSKQITIWPQRPVELCSSLEGLRWSGDPRGYEVDREGLGFVVDPRIDYRLFWYGGVLFSHTFQKDQHRPRESEHTLRCFTRSASPLTKLVQAVLETKSQRKATEAIPYTAMYVPEHTSKPPQWRLQSHKPARVLDTVQLDQITKQAIINDVARFLHRKTKTKYKARCIPYRRGYLFHGPPGSGKSSLAVAIAGHFKLSVYSLSLADPELTDSTLARLVAGTEESRAVILLEDVDAAGIGRETTATEMRSKQITVENQNAVKTKTSQVTLTGLLNAIDGATAPEGHILIMSSNCPADLDKALTRPGRVDVWMEFKNASSEQLRGMFVRFFTEEEEENQSKVPSNEEDAEDEVTAGTNGTDNVPVTSSAAADSKVAEPELAIGLTSFPIDQKHGLSQPQLEELAEEFVKLVPEYVMSVAQVQEYFIPRFGDPKSAVKGAAEWVNTVLEQEAAVPAEDLAGETRQGTPTPSLVDEERKEWADGGDPATDED